MILRAKSALRACPERSEGMTTIIIALRACPERSEGMTNDPIA